MSASYRVDLYQLNINVGDASLIVFSSYVPPYNPEIPNLKCIKAILVDGGIHNLRIYWRLIDSIQRLQDRYDASGISLTGIVVTHYDNDHVGGITMLLEQACKNPPDPIVAMLFKKAPVLLFDPGVRSDGQGVFGEYLDGVTLASTATTTNPSGLISRQNADAQAATIEEVTSPVDANGEGSKLNNLHRFIIRGVCQITAGR